MLELVGKQVQAMAPIVRGNVVPLSERTITHRRHERQDVVPGFMGPKYISGDVPTSLTKDTGRFNNAAQRVSQSAISSTNATQRPINITNNDNSSSPNIVQGGGQMPLANPVARPPIKTNSDGMYSIYS